MTRYEQSLNRMTAYLAAKREVSGLHPEVIHVIHANGGKHELTVSDIKVAIAAMRDASTHKHGADIDTKPPVSIHDDGKCIQTSDISSEIPVLTDQNIIDIVAIFNNPPSPKIRCEDCNGTGHIDVEDEDGYLGRCEDCDGYGYTHWATNQAERVKQVRENVLKYIKPVSVSLEGLFNAFQNADGSIRMKFKKALGAAGVKYVE